MALTGQSTPNYNLYKPALTDSPPDITSTNNNWDVIDSALKILRDNGLPSNINTKLPTAVASTEIKEVYISTLGSDETGDGTSGKPLRQISTAIARFGGTSRLVLRFSSGTYTEINAIEVSGCVGIEFLPIDGMNVAINVAYSQYGGYFSAKNIDFVMANSDKRDALNFYGTSVVIEDCSFKDKRYAVSCRNGSQAVVNRCRFLNCECAIYANNGSVVGANNIEGSENTYGYSSTASVTLVGTSTMTATTLATKAGGGIIFRNGNLFGSTANTFVNAT